jgi:hypothetical protein
MKRLLSLLFQREHDQWWSLGESDGQDPPNERMYMFTFDNLMSVIKRKLAKLGGKDETNP